MLADAVAIIGTMVCLKNSILMVCSTNQILFFKDLVFGYVLLLCSEVRAVDVAILIFPFSSEVDR